MTRTKYSILTDRAAELQRQADDLRLTLAWLDAAPCGLTCEACGTELTTEGDFARHFTVPDERFLNLGDCSINPRPRPATYRFANGRDGFDG